MRGHRTMPDPAGDSVRENCDNRNGNVNLFPVSPIFSYFAATEELEESMDTIRILVADDHPLFRDGVAALLGSVPDMVLIGQATTGKEAVVLAERLQPDVVLMDISMPEGNGITATSTILRISPHIGILVVTMFDDDDSLFAAMQ